MRAFGIFAGLTAAGIWGGMYVVSKVVLDIIPPFALISLRLIIGAVCLLVILLLIRGLSATRRQAWQVFLVGFVGYGVSIGFQFVGTKLSTASNAAVVTSASPVFIFIFGVILLGEKVTRNRVLALITATIGVLAVVDPQSAIINRETFWGNLSLVGASVTWGLYSVLIKQVSAYLSTLQVSLIAFLGGLPVSIPFAGWELVYIGVGEITLPIVMGVLYLGVISTALAMYLWNKSLAILDAGLVSLLFFAQPVVGVALGAGLLGERLSLAFWIGALLIAGGLILSSREQFSHMAEIKR
jgi:drug/metabolite transporter (DMT)-like permease